MKKIKAIIASLALFAMFAGTAAQAKVEIQWWHAFGGRLGELLDEQVNKFNASQDKYTVVHTRKGNYSETLNAGIAAFRAGQHPNILMVFEVGTASLMHHKTNTLWFTLEKVITQKLLTLVSLHSELDNIQISLWYLKLEQLV